MYRGKAIDRGQFGVVMSDIMHDLDVSRQVLRSAFQKLSRWRVVEVENSTNRFSIISICNYSTYQDVNNACQPTDNQPATNQQPTNNQPITNQQPTQEKNKGTREQGEQGEQVSKASVRFAPPTVGEVAEHCKAKGYSVDAEAFVAHYETCGWRLKRGPMKSWRAACVTWHKNSDQFQRGNGRAKQAVGFTPIPEEDD
jgi:hypothetical protein